jgi:hypothetical protein
LAAVALSVLGALAALIFLGVLGVMVAFFFLGVLGGCSWGTASRAPLLLVGVIIAVSIGHLRTLLSERF